LPAEFAEAAVSVVNGLFDIFVVNKPVADLFTFFHFVVVHLPVEDKRTAPAQRRFHDFARFFVLLLGRVMPGCKTVFPDPNTLAFDGWLGRQFALDEIEHFA